jgi:hypothetical protein
MGHIVGVFGPFGNYALVEMTIDQARGLVDEGEIEPAPVFIVDAVLGELDDLGKRDEKLAGSTLGALAKSLAYELANPHNSATSKAACARELREALDRLRELAPPEQTTDRLDEVKQRREQRRGRRRTADA